ncbi:unnamed protein product, partial [Ectocarpus sp. 13 AM-2016]
MSGVLFEDIFEVGKLNPDGKKFDRGENTGSFLVGESSQ